MNQATSAEPDNGVRWAALAVALLDYQAFPGRHSAALREPRILFERITDVLTLASGRTAQGISEDDGDLAHLREAARFFVRAAMLRQGVDHYTLLGVTPGFDPATLRDHYRMLIRMTHPDFAAGADVWPADAATRINLANDVLSSFERRQAYDLSLPRKPARAEAVIPARLEREVRPGSMARRDAQTRTASTWPYLAGGVLAGLLAMLVFWPSQTPQERLASLARASEEAEAKASKPPARVAVAPTPAAAVAAPSTALAAAAAPAAQAQPDKAPASVAPITRAAAPQEHASARAVVVAVASAAPDSAARSSQVVVAAAPIPEPARVPAPAPVLAASAGIAAAADGSGLRMSPSLAVVPADKLQTRVNPPVRTETIVAPARPPVQAAAQTLVRERVQPPVQAPVQVTRLEVARLPTSVMVPVPRVAVSVAPVAAPSPLPAQPARSTFEVASARPVPPPVAAVAPAIPLPATETPATRVAPPAVQPEPVVGKAASPELASTAGPRMSDAQPLLSQLLGALQSGRGDQAARLVDKPGRSDADARFASAYGRFLSGARVVRLGQVRFAGRPGGEQLVVDGVVQLHVQDDGQPVVTREFVLRALFALRAGQTVMTQLSAGDGAR